MLLALCSESTASSFRCCALPCFWHYAANESNALSCSITQMIKINVVLTALFLAIAGANAQFRGGNKNGFARGGRGRPNNGEGLVELSCEVADEPEPACALRDGDLGTWVCRNVTKPDTEEFNVFSTCANTTRALPSDTCGCCDGICPTACTCECTLDEADGGGPGFLLTVSKKFGEPEQKCFAPEKAISLVAKPRDRFQCVADAACPVRN
jgi:hypothetical protein